MNDTKPTIFPSQKPYLNQDGSLFVPEDTTLPGDTDLTPREWLVLIAEHLDMSRCDRKTAKLSLEALRSTSRSNLCRVRKSLRNKGYL